MEYVRTIQSHNNEYSLNSVKNTVPITYSSINGKTRVTIVEGGLKENHAHSSRRLIRLQISLLSARIDKRTLVIQVEARMMFTLAMLAGGGGGDWVGTIG